MTKQVDGLSAVPDRELAWCHEAVQDVSRTFALTIDVLEEPASSYICVGYLVCRIADTIEDSRSLSATEKAFLLDRYDRVLDPDQEYDADAFEEALEPYVPASQTDDWAVVTDSSRVLRTFDRLPPGVREAILPPTRELIGGMKTFVERYADSGGIRIRTGEELEEYCYYVAGTVGHLITNLLVREAGDREADQLGNNAVEFGLLLQLVNIAKDVYDDYTGENSVFLPADWLQEVGVSQEDVLARENAQEVVSVVRRTASHARTYLDDAQAYLEILTEVDGNAFEAWAIPFLLAVGTLRELLARPEDALSPEGVKISREEVAAVVQAVTTDARSESLAALRESVQRGELAR